MAEVVICELCGEPMPRGEEMFNYHGYSGPCPKPPMSRELKRCPFCGKEAQMKGGVAMRLWWVACNAADCEAEGPSRLTRDEAVQAWNQRAD